MLAPFHLFIILTSAAVCDVNVCACVQTTLRLTISTLTDLDLSYSFTGIKGAKVRASLVADHWF